MQFRTETGYLPRKFCNVMAEPANLPVALGRDVVGAANLLLSYLPGVLGVDLL